MLTSRPVTVYKAAVFVSAFLTFSMQPLVAKRLLPVLGGAPAVWNTCLLFFQLMLLAGYLLADRTVRVAPRRQTRAAPPAARCWPAPAFRCGCARWASPRRTSDPAVWLLGHLALTVGVPFLVLCSNTTVVQSWYARRSAAERDEAYTLYRWSNAGSLLGLLAYPVLVEPALSIGQQQWAWVTLYAGLVVLIAACARAAGATPDADVGREAAAGLLRRPFACGRAGSCWPSCHRASRSASPATSRPTLRPCPCCGSCRWRSTCSRSCWPSARVVGWRRPTPHPRSACSRWSSR